MVDDDENNDGEKALFLPVSLFHLFWEGQNKKALLH